MLKFIEEKGAQGTIAWSWYIIIIFCHIPPYVLRKLRYVIHCFFLFIPSRKFDISFEWWNFGIIQVIILDGNSVYGAHGGR